MIIVTLCVHMVFYTDRLKALKQTTISKLAGQIQSTEVNGCNRESAEDYDSQFSVHSKTKRKHGHQMKSKSNRDSSEQDYEDSDDEQYISDKN